MSEKCLESDLSLKKFKHTKSFLMGKVPVYALNAVTLGAELSVEFIIYCVGVGWHHVVTVKKCTSLSYTLHIYHIPVFFLVLGDF